MNTIPTLHTINLPRKLKARFYELIAPGSIKLGLEDAEMILEDYFPDNGKSCIRSKIDSLIAPARGG